MKKRVAELMMDRDTLKEVLLKKQGGCQAWD